MKLTKQKVFFEENQYYVKAFLYGVFVSFLFFLPFILYDKGYFLYYGDFNVQQIPFYNMVHDAIRNGEFFWNWNTDLGVNLIGSYTFYLLTSPFFWLTLPFSSTAVPYLMGPLLILKFGCASLTAYIYLKRYAKNQNFAVLAAALYAFSGFSIYNIFFNHFHEAIIIFPLLLWALDAFMYQKRRGIFAFMVFASCFINYYFFVGQVVFLLLYWIVKMFMGTYRCSIKGFLVLLFESVIGVLMTAVVLFPTILAVIQNPRVSNPPSGWGALLYSHEQRYIHILQSFFFPPDIPARPNFTPDSDAKWASLGAYLPLFSMVGVIAWMQRKKDHWLKRLLPILFLMAMIPILNSAFQLFNSAYYARWFYMITLMMSLCTLLSLESAGIDWKRAIKSTAVITLAIALPIGLLPKTTGSGNNKKTTIGLMAYPDRFWIYVGFAVLSLVLLAFLLKYYKKEQKQFCRVATVSLVVVTFVTSTYIIGLGKSQSYSTHNYIIPYCLGQKQKFNLPDTKNCRVDVYNGMDNLAMFWQLPTIQAFHSIVPGSIMEFYPTIGVKRDVGSRPDTKPYGLRALTSCRWLFDDTADDKSFQTVSGQTLMPGWDYYDTQHNFAIFENRYYIPYGFSYDNYVTKKQYDGVDEANRHLLLLKAIVLDDEGVNKNKDILKPIGNPSALLYTENAYFEDCNKRKQMACSSFKRGKNEFTAEIDISDEKDRLVFFSVPYEKGWSATVNGVPEEIQKVNIGFMAVRVPKGIKSTIHFTYQTPGLLPGTFVSIGAAAIFAGYAIWSKRNRKERIGGRYYPATQQDQKILKNYQSGIK